MEAELEIYFLLARDKTGKNKEEISAVFPQFNEARMDEALQTLTRSRALLKSKGRYLRNRSIPLVVGAVDAKERGFGFLMGPDGDYYISPRSMNGAMHGDIALVKKDLKKKGRGRRGGPEGEVVEVLRRRKKQVIGRFEFHDSYALVVPSDKRMFYNLVVPKGKRMGAQEGQIVKAEIEKYPEKWGGLLLGRITEVLGDEWDSGIQVEIIIREHNLRTEFPEEVLREAAERAETASDTSSRRDFRKQKVVTIDGLDAKDFDDAVSLEKTKDGYYLAVHIADVAHYVRFGGALMEEAEARATSVYLVDRVLPMLPPVLSNDICSLRPQEDRLTMSVEMWLDNEGKVKKSAIHNGIIRSRARLTYEEVDAFFTGEKHGLEPEVASMLQEMRALSQLLQRKRVERGSLDFEGVEPKVILDEDGDPTDILLRKRTDATQLIEEAMLLTNETVARFMRDKAAGMIYRIHDEPDSDLMAQLTELLGAMGFQESSDSLSPVYLQKILEYAKDKPEELLVNTMLLRSMKQARYSNNLNPHFGLASDCYTHFTSPIRRLPDLIVHHLLKMALRLESRTEAVLPRLAHLAEHSSRMEREAEGASRESVQVKICQYMERHVGESFSAIISGVANYGIFVELANTAEGLIHINDLPSEGWTYEEKHFQLISRKTRKRFKLGDTVEVILKRVKVAERQMDFILA